MSVVELVTFPASDAFVANQSVFKPAMDTLIKTKGCISAHYGLQVENKKIGYLIIVWETYEHHKELMEAANYGDLIRDLKPALAGDLDMQHIEYDISATQALTAPATEIVVFKLKPGISKEALTAKVVQLNKELIKADSCHSAAFGKSRERSETWASVIGWDSVEAHVETVKGTIFKPLIDEIRALADIDLKHTNLVKHVE